MSLQSPLYQPGPPPVLQNPAEQAYLQGELRRISIAIQQLAARVPQVEDTAPARPQKGMIRYAVAPWNPLGTGSNVWVYFDGSTWKAL